jgi:hypothetical protein
MRIYYESSPGKPDLIGIIEILRNPLAMNGSRKKKLFDTLQLVAQDIKLLTINKALLRIIAISDI